jgi:hypothetical protein
MTLKKAVSYNRRVPAEQHRLCTQGRSHFYGLKYFDADFTVMKNVRVSHWEPAKIGVGAQVFNLVNHPNFNQPIGDVSNSSFGSTISTANTPTSILGSLFEGDASLD